MMWKLDYFSQNIWRGQIGLRTRIFDQFLHFDDLQAFATYDENVKSGAHGVKIELFLSEYLKGSYWSWNSNFWSVFVFW